MIARALVLGSSGLGYVAATHWLMTSAPASGWNAVGVVGPMLIAVAVLGWRSGQRTIGVLCVAAAGALVLEAWRGTNHSPATLYVAQHVVIHAALAFLFGRSLASGHEPLLATLASRVHERMTPPMLAYARRATLAWTLYFIAMGLLSIALFLSSPFEVWATFANIATPLAVVVMFLGEYVVRYRLHPEFERATIASAIRAWAERRHG